MSYRLHEKSHSGLIMRNEYVMASNIFSFCMTEYNYYIWSIFLLVRMSSSCILKPDAHPFL